MSQFTHKRIHFEILDSSRAVNTNFEIMRKQSLDWIVVDTRKLFVLEDVYGVYQASDAIVETITTGDNTIPDLVLPGTGDTQIVVDQPLDSSASDPLGDSHGGGSGIGESIVFLMDNKTGVFP